MGRNQDDRTGDRGILEGADPESKVKAEQDPGENQPSDSRLAPVLPNLLTACEGKQHQRGKNHPVGGNDQCRRLTELNKNGSRRGG